MKSQKGITLTSLAMYIVLILIVLAILATVSANMQGNVRNSGKEGTDISEINKFNMYFLKEVKKQGNSIESITSSDIEVEENIPGDSIEFSNGKKFLYDSSNYSIELIEQNKTIKLAKNIENCTFTEKMSNGKIIIEVKIKPKGLNIQTIEFVLNSESLIYENENDYIRTVPETYAKATELTLGSNVSLVEYEDLTDNIKTDVDSGKVSAVIEETVGEGNNAVTYTAVVPVGYTISSTENENTVTKGLVIYDGTSSDRNNEFVWIPVPGKDMQVATMTVPYQGSTSAYREPRELTSKDSRTGATAEERLVYDSQEELDYYYGVNYFTYPSDVSDENNVTDFSYGVHYKEMAQSVNKYGGFYIGRYETTIDGTNIGSKYNTEVLTTDKIIKEGTNNNANTNGTYTYRWWGLYYAQRHSNVAGNGSQVQTNMISAQQLDKMLAFLDSQSISYAAIDTTNTYKKPLNVSASGQTTYTSITQNPEIPNIKDEIFNIYDLRTNVYDFTTEAYYTGSRVTYGGYYGNSLSVNSHNNYSPYFLNRYIRFTSLTLHKIIANADSYAFVNLKYRFIVMKFCIIW